MQPIKLRDEQGEPPLPPAAKGLPVLGNALQMLEDPLRYLLELYQELGPIYRMRALNRSFTVMAGPQANQFASRVGDEFLGSEELFGGFAREMGTMAFLPALDGDPHRHLRKIMRPGFSKDTIVPHIPRVVEITQQFVRSWPEDQALELVPALQRIIVEQLGTILVNHPPGEYYEDIWTFFNFMMNVEVIKKWPHFMLNRPSYNKSKQRVYEFAGIVLDEHRASPPHQRKPDLIDSMLAARDEEGEAYDEKALLVSAIAPYFAGIDTVANTCGFMLYALLKNPEALERVQVDVEALFDKGLTDLADWKEARQLYAATIETLRMYPVAAFMPRTAVKPFEFAGYRVEAGTEVLVATGVTHYLPEFFPEPEKFDLDRYLPPRSEHRQASAFVPYGLGAHTCLGAGLAEIQIMVTVAAVLQAARFRLDPPDHQIQISMTPIPGPGRGLKVMKVGQRGEDR
jgi:cytochrome P450